MIVDFYDKNFVRKGRLPAYDADLELRYNAVSTGVVDVNITDERWTAGRFILEGAHLVVREDLSDDEPLVSGVITGYEYRQVDGRREMSVKFSDHLTYLAGMITVPSPGRGLTSQSDAAYYQVKGDAETVIKDLVRSHVGQGARAENKIRGFQVVASKRRGKTVSLKTRFKNVLEEVQSLALSGGLKIWTMIDPVSKQIRFDVAEPVDRSKNIRIREGDGSLSQYSYTLDAPTASRVLVAGQGEGAARELRVVESDPTAWGVKTLLFQDRRDTDDTDELVQAGEDTLADNVEKASISLETTQVNRRFNRDYFLGDTITVDLQGTVKLRQPLQRVELSFGAEPKTILHVGPYLEEDDPSGVLRTVRRLRSDLRTVQAK